MKQKNEEAKKERKESGKKWKRRKKKEMKEKCGRKEEKIEERNTSREARGRGKGFHECGNGRDKKRKVIVGEGYKEKRRQEREAKEIEKR